MREPWEYVQGHIPGAQNIPLGEIENVASTLEGPMVLICANGNCSGFAAQYLASLGQTEVANPAGGTFGYVQRGLLLE